MSNFLAVLRAMSLRRIRWHTLEVSHGMFLPQRTNLLGMNRLAATDKLTFRSVAGVFGGGIACLVGLHLALHGLLGLLTLPVVVQELAGCRPHGGLGREGRRGGGNTVSRSRFVDHIDPHTVDSNLATLWDQSKCPD